MIFQISLGGALKSIFQESLSVAGAGTFLICIDCSLQLLAACLALELVAGGQVFGVVTWAKWVGRAQ